MAVQTDQTYLGPARELVEAGAARRGMALSKTLRQALARAIARAIRRPVSPDRLTWRLALARERGALLVAEGCLIPLGLFPDRVRRGGPVPAYVGVGRAAYRAAGHLEPAYGFHLTVEALRFLRGPDQSGLLSLARDDSETATRVLRGHPVLVSSSR